jgi:hypothetical protein
MFLLARLIIHELQVCSNLEELEKAGNNLPSGLYEAWAVPAMLCAAGAARTDSVFIGTGEYSNEYIQILPTKN